MLAWYTKGFHVVTLCPKRLGSLNWCMFTSSEHILSVNCKTIGHLLMVVVRYRFQPFHPFHQQRGFIYPEGNRTLRFLCSLIGN